jgi:serine/threonine-protein kinase
MDASPPRPPQPGKPTRGQAFLEPGMRVGRYRIDRRLGGGAMGEVYLATDEELGRRAAIKVLGVKHLVNHTLKERFLLEARSLAGLSHPNVIPVFEAGDVGDPPRPYYAMELLEGGDTQKLLDERGRLPSSVVALIGAQAATGLGEAARARIIHRDVKPSNLGISRHGVLKVTDFGLAKSFAMDHKLTGKGLVVGTADYIAPEQARGEEVDARADVYSLGCTLFHLITGHPPYRAPEGTAVQQYIEVMRAHVNEPVPDPRTEAPEADPELVSTIERMMAKDRDERPTFDNVAPVLARIAARLGGELPRVTRQIFTVPLGVPTRDEEPPVVAPPAVHHWRSVAAVLALILSAIALYLALRGR